MAGYVKLFSDVLDSSIWQEDATTRVLWITLLALADCDGFIRGSPGWLALKAHITESKCREALAKFEGPDPFSRTAENDGRRIESLPDGWLILNYLKFRDRLSPDPKAVQSRVRVRRHRERYQALRNAGSVTDDASASLSGTHSSVEGGGSGGGNFREVETPSWEQVQLFAAGIGLAEWRARDWFDEMQQTGWRDTKNRDVFNWKAYLSRIKTWWQRDGSPLTPPSRNGTTTRPKTALDLKTILQAKERRAAEIKAAFCSEAGVDTRWRDQDKRKEWNALRKEIRGLNLQLSQMA